MNATDIDAYVNSMRKQKGLVWSSGFLWKPFKTITLKAIQTNTAANNTNVKFIFGDNGHFLAVVQIWRNLHMKKLISTGFYFVNSALAMCDQVHVYGFWPFDFTIILMIFLSSKPII